MHAAVKLLLLQRPDGSFGLCRTDGAWHGMVAVVQEEGRQAVEGVRVLTVGPAELGDGLDEALVQVGRPPQPRLGVPRQHHPAHRPSAAVPGPLHPLEHAHRSRGLPACVMSLGLLAISPRPGPACRSPRSWWFAARETASSSSCN